MRYAEARLEQELLDYAYRVYITDSLKARGEGMRLTERFADLVKQHPVDNRTGEQIAEDIIKRAGIEVI